MGYMFYFGEVGYKAHAVCDLFEGEHGSLNSQIFSVCTWHDQV